MTAICKAGGPARCGLTAGLDMMILLSGLPRVDSPPQRSTNGLVSIARMKYDSLIVLIPSHSLEDFPSEIGEREAASLLNAFAVVWHPALLASAEVLPMWHRADSPPEFAGNRLVVVPTPCDSWLQGGWVERARTEGSTVVAGLSDRHEMLAECLKPLENLPPIDPELVADFLALGTCYLLIELLTRKMHYYSNLDEVRLTREAVAAAQAALAGDGVAARTRLKDCFEVLTSARERFYPVDCYLIDLCLVVPQVIDQHFDAALQSPSPMNFLLTAKDLEEIARDKPDAAARLAAAWQAGQCDVIGGEYAEGPSPLLSVPSVLWDFRRGHRVFKSVCGRTPTTWARRRFGFTPLIPQVLTKSGYKGAMHVALDDGIYPDAEQSRIRWEGCDGSLIDSVSRIPLAAEPSTSYARFPSRMAESMEQDQTAAILFARWPETKSPWFEDLRRTHQYSPCLGKWVTFERYFESGEAPGRLSKYEAREYFTPFLIQSVARQETNPVTRYRDALLRRHRYDAAAWCEATAAALMGRTIPDGDTPIAPPAGMAGVERREPPAGDSRGDAGGSQSLDPSHPAVPGEAPSRERLIEDAGPDAAPEAIAAAESMLAEYAPQAARKLAEVILAGGSGTPGALVLNPLSFARKVSVELPSFSEPPAIGGAVKAVQFDGIRKSAVLELPPCGFLWVAPGGKAAPPKRGEGAAMVEDAILRNDFCEVYINEATGGIARIKGYGRQPNRLSQQIAYRFPRERTPQSVDGEPGERTYYSEMRCDALEVVSNGPAVGEIRTRGSLIDPQEGSTLATFTQSVRVWRARPVVEVELELDCRRTPDGDPWTNYYASRFAWNDMTAALTRSFQQGAHGFTGERIESPHYIEIAEDEQRTTLLTMGLAFHRKTGPRMLDSIMITAEEKQRKFRFVIVTDSDYPMQSAHDAMVPTPVVAGNGPPRSGPSGWLFHVDAKSVQLMSIMPLENPAEGLPAYAQHDFPTTPGSGFGVRLLETEGRRRTARLRTFRTPTRARQRDFQGRTLTDLAIEGDAVVIDMAPYEIADVELFI